MTAYNEREGRIGYTYPVPASLHAKMTELTAKVGESKRAFLDRAVAREIERMMEDESVRQEGA